MSILQKILALAALLFGLATIGSGVRVLTGSDPGYLVFRPLLIYNTLMGLVYVAGGVISWRNIKRGASVAAMIFLLNLIVLGAIGYLYLVSNAVALESLRAMSFRTLVWLVLFFGFAWLSRRRPCAGR